MTAAEQRRRFEETARELGCDDGQALDAAFGKILRRMTPAARAAGIVAMIQRRGGMEPAEAAQALTAAIREAQDAALNRVQYELSAESVKH